MRPTVHLLANSHLDPVWLWEWPEGAAEAVALARVAADLCEGEEGFVFNRGEAQFYAWIERYDPTLFARIGDLVEQGKWHVMGGWYVQPDCNLPCGEAMLRQIREGRRWFRDRFGVVPRVAANLDPFGHSRGLVQLLAGCGYDGYLFCRPDQAALGFPDTEFTWVGYDGSTVTAALAAPHYNSAPGGARAKVEAWLERYAGKGCALIPWGVGNHGGGPSRQDCRQLAALAAERGDVDIRHSTPEAFFADLRRRRHDLHRHEGDLNPWAVGCYTSMVRVKQAYRAVEAGLLAAEKMRAPLAARGELAWPGDKLDEAWRDLLFCQFHDCLPGSATAPVEAHLLRLLGRAREVVDELTVEAGFHLAAGGRPARPGEYPVFAYNPHPWPVEALVEIELQEPWPNTAGGVLVPTVRRAGRAVPVQSEQPAMNMADDLRQRLVFAARLRPGHLERFDALFERRARRPARPRPGSGSLLGVRTDELEAAVDPRTGLLARYRVGGRDLLAPGAGRLLVLADDADPWGMRVDRFRRRVGSFRLASARMCARIAGVEAKALPPVRVVEDGPVRRVVEAIFAWQGSFAVVRYKLPRAGRRLELEVLLDWREKDRMVKLALPTPCVEPEFLGQVLYGRERHPADGREVVVQQWAALAGAEGVLACINRGTYGADAKGGELRPSLLRSPAHAGHPMGPDRPIVAQDRHTPRIDQGVRVFTFWLLGAPDRSLLDRIDREALALNERPFAFYAYPAGKGAPPPPPAPTLSDRTVLCTACTAVGDRGELRVRLFEPTGRRRTTTLSWAGQRTRVTLAPFQVLTLAWNGRRWRRVGLLD